MRNLIAILRGIRPSEAPGIAGALVEAGILKIEVPMNSPEPFRSIEAISDRFGDQALIGGGTVTCIEQVKDLSSAGGGLCVSPDCNPEVISAAKSRGMISIPGCMTPTECFAAIRSGADAIKLFPYFLLADSGLAAIKAVLPPDVETYAVGGVGTETFAGSLAAGINGFGFGSSLYKPGARAEDVARAAREIVAAFDEAASKAHGS